MTGSFSDAYENEIVDRATGKSPSVARYLALCTVAVSDTDTGSTITEPSGNNYARIATADTDWTSSSGGAASNATQLISNTASGSWGTIVAVALCTASSGGTLIAYDSGITSKAIATGDAARFAIGEIDISQTS
jgi:hypothetical protein